MTNYAEVFNSYYMLLMNIVLKYLTAITCYWWTLCSSI